MIKLFTLVSLSMLVLILPRIDPDVASLGGQVTAEKLAGIAAATISARNAFSGEVEYATSDATGLYKFAALRQGRYSVFVEAEDYCSKWVFNVFLVRGEHTHLDVMLVGSRKKYGQPIAYE